MIAVDTNLLVYAHREDSPWHDRSLQRLTELAKRDWAIPWPCIHEFLAIVTHPRVFDPPTPMTDAWKTVDDWLRAPRLRMLAEIDGYAATLRNLVTTARVAGPRVHDARIAALCLVHGVEALWSADRDFSRFSQLVTHNPLH